MLCVSYSAHMPTRVIILIILIILLEALSTCRKFMYTKQQNSTEVHNIVCVCVCARRFE